MARAEAGIGFRISGIDAPSHSASMIRAEISTPHFPIDFIGEAMSPNVNAQSPVYVLVSWCRMPNRPHSSRKPMLIHRASAAGDIRLS